VVFNLFVYWQNEKQKEFKAKNLNGDSKKEFEKVLFPFKKKDSQRLWSIVFIIMGLLMMIIKPLSNIIDNIGVNSFITGLIITFAGFFYFMDIQ